MNKLYFLLLVAFFGNAHAQTTCGLKAGYTLSNMKFDDSDAGNYHFDSKSSFYVGGLAEHQLSEKFAIQGELLYTELGGSYTEDLYSLVGNEVVYIGKNKTTITTSQLQIPVSAKFYAAKPLAISAGINFGIDLSTKVKNAFVSEFTQDGNAEWFKTLNIFPFIGSEYHFTKNIFAEVRYHFNFVNTAKEYAPITKIGFLQAGLGYRFN